jgi:hypothetical protein
MVMISTGNNAVHNVMGGENVKNFENSKYKAVWEPFSTFGMILIAAANVPFLELWVVQLWTSKAHQLLIWPKTEWNCEIFSESYSVFQKTLKTPPQNSPQVVRNSQLFGVENHRYNVQNLVENCI